LLAGDHQAEPVGGRREVALHQAVDRPARQAGVDHRVDLPVAERLEVEQLRANLAVEDLGVNPVVETSRLEHLERGELGLQVDDPGQDPGLRIVFEPDVVLVEADGRPFAGVGLEPRRKIGVDELGKGRRRLVARATAWQQQQPADGGEKRECDAASLQHGSRLRDRRKGDDPVDRRRSSRPSG
jgi:hypothetical protein